MLRRPDSISAGDIVIEDPAMEPFFITKSQSSGYTVYQRVTKGDNNTDYIKTICYPSTFNYALKRVANELLNYGEKTHFTTLKEYLNKWEKVQDKMALITSIDL